MEHKKLSAAKPQPNSTPLPLGEAARRAGEGGKICANPVTLTRRFYSSRPSAAPIAPPSPSGRGPGPLLCFLCFALCFL